MSLVMTIADAVVAELAKGTFSQKLTPVRRVLPDFELAELAEMKVSIVPKAIEITPGTRALGQYDYQIDIGVQKKLGADLDAEVAVLCNLMEEIADYLRARALGGAPYAQWIQTTNVPIYAPDHLAKKRAFTSVLTVTYRVMAA